MRNLTYALFASLSLFACSAADSSELSDEVEDTGEAALSNPNYGYFVAERDFRKCAYPMCGGYYVHRVNASKTRCIDGSYEARCYVTEIDFSKLGLQDGVDEVHAVFRGAIEKREINKGTWGVLVAGEVWAGETGSAATGSFYRAKDNGIRCIKAPCPSIGAHKLNTNAQRQLVGVDLAKTGASQAQIDKGMDAIFGNEDGLLVAGTIAPAKGGGNALTASEFFRKLTGVRSCGSRGLGPCNQNEFCAFGANANCGRADAPGVCTVRPQVCIQLYKPVCGCDGKTYSNSCHAAGAGVSVDYQGACQN